MKRILLSVFAAALTAAWVVPAGAADVTFSGQYRLRGEYRNNMDYTDNTSDTVNYWGQRVRLTANAKATDDTSVKITLQDSRILGSDNLISGVSGNVDLHEAYLNVDNIFGTPVSFRAGRQELNYGDQRLVGSFGWSNFGRAFDGVKFGYANDVVSVDAFAMTITEGTTVTTNAATGATALGGLNDDTSLNGIYATVKSIPNNTLDLYVLHQSNNTDLTRYTIGARLKGAVAGLDYTLELPYQTGEQTQTPKVDISSYALAAKVGYTLPTPMNVRVGAEYDFAKGDKTSTTDKNEAFNNLYPTNHDHFGIADVVNSWSNISAWSLNANAAVTEQANVYVAYWNYTADQVAPSVSDKLGSEFDIVAKYKYNNAVSIEAGASRFFVDDGTSLAPNQDDQDFAYLMLTANF